MSTKRMLFGISTSLVCLLIIIRFSFADDLMKRQGYLEQLLRWVPPLKPAVLDAIDVTWQEDLKWQDINSFIIHHTFSKWGSVSPLDATWRDWLERTDELPPNFDAMPSIPFLPDPLVLDDGWQNIPITTMEQWQKKREWIKKEFQHWVTGTIPPPPQNMKSKVVSEKKDGKITLQTVELLFGPDHRAKMTLIMMIPPGEGPFPVYLTQWNHINWALLAVRRGYIGCIYAGSDDKDDTEAYAEIYYPEYDFSRLMRRAWGGHRAVDYLYTLPYVDKDKIAVSGHSRNGKQSLLAAAFDERISAVWAEGGTGAENPYRFCDDKTDTESIAEITSNFPNWFHPRLRFFIGREHKLPVDQNLLMALVAPRGLMLCTPSQKSSAGNTLGAEQAYHSAKRVYDFAGAGDKLTMTSVHGHTGTLIHHIQAYIDFFDYVFGRSLSKTEPILRYTYTFEKWRELSGENIDPSGFSEKTMNDLLKDEKGKNIKTTALWGVKKKHIQEQIRWVMGDKPAGVTNPGPGQNNYLTNVINGQQAKRFDLKTQKVSETMAFVSINPSVQKPPSTEFRCFGDNLAAKLYYPINEQGRLADSAKLPVLILLHEYDYSSASADGGRDLQMQTLVEDLVNRKIAVFTFDMIGMGTRIYEGERFYDRFPRWSKMGKMIADTRAAVDALMNMEFIDADKIFVAGYSLGATVGLYSAALDDRIAGVVSVCGFTPMRGAPESTGIEGVKTYSHLHGLIPRLGFFSGSETRIPYDFHEILACIAPRPLLVVAPEWDRDAVFHDVRQCIDEVKKIYQLYKAPEKLEFFAPDDYNRFPPELKAQVAGLIEKISHYNMQ